jgi:hypothetical protein
MNLDVLKSVSLVSKGTAIPRDSLTLATCDDPVDPEAFIVDQAGVILAKAIMKPAAGWAITREGAERISAESRTLLSFARPS